MSNPKLKPRYVVIWVPPDGDVTQGPDEDRSSAIDRARVIVTQRGGVAVVERRVGREGKPVYRFEQDEHGVARRTAL